MRIKTKLTGAVLAALVLFAGCAPEVEKVPYGQELTLANATEISKILENPESFLGKKVQIAGTIADVCESQGCWIEISAADSEQKLKVKVNDGEIVFPVAAKGKLAVAEGEVYKLDLDKEQAIAYLEHLAEEKGETFDPATVSGPVVIYQLKGHGAQIEK